MRTPASVLAEILRSDPARPRVTFYEDTVGPTQGERIELSGKVLANWVAKGGNALQDEYDVGPGSVVRLCLPPHWRALYWAFAVWSVGGIVDLVGGRTTDLLICDDPELPATVEPAPGDVVVVTLADPAPQDLALISRSARTTYNSVVPQCHWPPRARVSLVGDLAQVLESTLAAWSVDGSVVLARNGQRAGGEPQPERLASEHVTLDLASVGPS